jgi:hypothetical protein
MMRRRRACPFAISSVRWYALAAEVLETLAAMLKLPG